jgi:proline iminopeptidase
MKLKSCLALLCLPAALAAQQSGYVTVSDGARLFYRTSGRPGPGIDTLIAIHGGPGLDLGTIYNDLALMFGDRHVVIYYDQRGGGRSELPADTTRLVAARQIQDLDDLRSTSACSASRSWRTRTARCSREATPSRTRRT